MSRHTRFWWVRHGPTHAKAMIGWTDIAADLSDAPALRRLSDRLPTTAPIISSDLKRARDTATALQGGRRRLDPDPRLREIHFGDWEGKTAAEIDSPAARAFWEQPGEISAPGGESRNDVLHRVGAAVEALAPLGPDVIVVAHMGAIMAAVQRARGIAAIDAFSHQIPPLSLTVIEDDIAEPIGRAP